MFILLFHQYITVAGGIGCPGSTYCYDFAGGPYCECFVGTGGNPLGGCCRSCNDCATGLECDFTEVNTANPSGFNYRCAPATAPAK